MTREELEATIDGMIYDVIADLDSEHMVLLPSHISMQLASLIMDKVEQAEWVHKDDAPCAECDAERDARADAYEGYLTAMEIITEGR